MPLAAWCAESGVLITELHAAGASLQDVFLSPHRPGGPGMTATGTGTPGAFARGIHPDPRPAPVRSMIAAQSAMELRLLLRNGEQPLLTMFIPITHVDRPVPPLPLSTDAGDSAAAPTRSCPSC